MFRLLLFALMVPVSLFASELLRDQHENETYIFELNAADVPASVEEAQAILIGTKWAMRFYQDAFLTTEGCEFKLAPIRRWLVTLTYSESKAEVLQLCCRRYGR